MLLYMSSSSRGSSLTSPRGSLTNDPFDLSCNGSPTDPKMMIDAGKAAVVKGVETRTTAQTRIKAGRRDAEDARMIQLIHEQLSMCFAGEETMPLAAAG
eukprot:jgi/Tetstr1/455411/TSEL_042243.t1